MIRKALLLLAVHLCGISALSAQSSDTHLQFSRPIIIADLNEKPSIAGRFDCSEDGSIYTFVDGYAKNSGITPKERLELLAIHPDGSVVSFPWRSVSGFTHISLPKSVFVVNSRVYVLVEGDRDPAPGGKRAPYPLVLTFTQNGVSVRSATLEQGLDPLVLGVFKSGNMLVISEDRLNHRMALDLIGQDGAPLRQMDLGTSDYLVRSPEIETRTKPRKYNSTLMIAMSKFFSYEDHLLLVPLETSGLPVVELSEDGVVKTLVPRLPNGEVLDALIAATRTELTFRLAKIVQTEHPALDAEGNLMSVGTTPSQTVTNFSAADGRMTREIEIGAQGVQPACEAGGVLRLLTSTGNAGRLAVVTAKLP